MFHSIRRLREDSAPSPSRLWYNKWVEHNPKGKVLDVGKSTYWDYGFDTIDVNPELKPTYVGNIEKTSFPEEMFNTVLCNGMYECVSDPQKMVDEIYRILRKGGIAIFGFVGKEYKPYKKDWKFYKEDIDWGSFKIIDKQDFDTNYHFIVCQKP